MLLVNQHTVPIFVDVANACAASSADVTLFTGHIEPGKQPLNPAIKIVKSKFYQRKSSMTRVTSWLIFSTHYFLYLIFCKKPSKILVVSNPPIAPMITSWVAGIRGLTYYILIYDLYPEALLQAGFTGSNSWLYRRWQKINFRTFERATKIFTLSESMKKAVSVYASDNESKIKVIYNWVDTGYIIPIEKTDNPFVLKNGLQDKVVILYAGNMGLTHDLESLLESADLLRKNTSLYFVFIGDGGKKQKLMKMKEEKKLTNVLFLPFQDAAQFPNAMAAADIGVVTLGLGAEGISVPSKTYVTMAAGLCLMAIAPLDSELTRLVNHHEVGVAVEPGRAMLLSEQITFLASHPDALNKYKEAARNCSFLFSPENAFHYVDEMASP